MYNDGAIQVLLTRKGTLYANEHVSWLLTERPELELNKIWNISMLWLPDSKHPSDIYN